MRSSSSSEAGRSGCRVRELLGFAMTGYVISSTGHQPQSSPDRLKPKRIRRQLLLLMARLCPLTNFGLTARMGWRFQSSLAGQWGTPPTEHGGGGGIPAEFTNYRSTETLEWSAVAAAPVIMLFSSRQHLWHRLFHRFGHASQFQKLFHFPYRGISCFLTRCTAG